MNLAPGFDGNHVITASLSMQDARYTSASKMNQLYDESLARIRALPEWNRRGSDSGCRTNGRSTMDSRCSTARTRAARAR